jgi:glycosyltransferase involved in cell wall biosynthesis
VAALGSEPGIVVTGYVPDVLPYFGGADVYVAPLRVGGGTRLKLLEAMAAGIPLVSTRLGAEGIALEAGRHALLADGAEAFAQAVLQLLHNPGQAGALAQAARQLVVERYDWDCIAPVLERVYAGLASISSATRRPKTTA